MTIIGNIIESARKFSLHKSATLENPNNIKIFYECLNIHLSLSLGSIGLYWEQTSTSPKLIIFALIYFLIGIAFKASLSEHQPERISIRDSDSLCGFIIPNACAVSLMATLTLINIRVIGKDEIMTFIAILIIGMILGVCISLLFSSLLSCLIKNRLPVKEQIRIDSLDSIDKLLGQTKKRYLTNGELNKLKSEIMNYIANAYSEHRANQYIDKIDSVIGEPGTALIKYSKKLLQEKFHAGGRCTHMRSGLEI